MPLQRQIKVQKLEKKKNPGMQNISDLKIILS
jgi:hypothetical protein